MKPGSPREEISIGADGKSAIVLRLYIAGGTLASKRAWSNLTALCDQQGHDCFEVDVVDILREPLRALSEGILVTPTLVRLSPMPVVKIVGDLSDRAGILHALGLTDVRAK